MAKKILILDDDETILYFCGIICEGLGLDVVKSSTTDAILSQVFDHKPDIILMDNWIPGTGSAQAIRLIKSQESLKGIPIIFFSASTGFGVTVKEPEADAHLKKPFDLETLESLIVSLLSANDPRNKRPTMPF